MIVEWTDTHSGHHEVDTDSRIALLAARRAFDGLADLYHLMRMAGHSGVPSVDLQLEAIKTAIKALRER